MSKKECIENMCIKGSLRWTEKMDEAFIHAMVKQQDDGNRIDGTFSTQAYMNMVEELSATLHMNFTKSHLQNRLKTLKQRFSLWYDIFRGTSLSGFSWNSSTQLMEAEEEVWAELIKSKPEAVTLKTKKMSNYPQLLELFGRDRATGAHAETAKEKNARLHMNGGINIETITELDDLVATNEVTLENQSNSDDDIQLLYSTSSQSEPTSGAKKYKSRKRKIEQEEALNEKLVNCVESVAAAIKEGNKILERAFHNEYTGDEIYKELEPMGLEPHEIQDAIIFLSDNQAKARTLFSCPSQIRMGLLKKMMNAGNSGS